MTNKIVFMNKCRLCNCNTSRPKYCSSKCIKHAWYLRNSRSNNYEKGGDFWKTETGIGFKWEKWVADKIGATHLEFNGGGCDLELNGLQIDVKACNLWKRQNKRGKPVVSEQKGVWVFNRNKLKKCDFFICVCLINHKVHKVLKIPASEFPPKGSVIGFNSKYDTYKITL